MKAENREQGGARFSVRLPSAPAGDGEPSAPRRARRPGGGGLMGAILVVDDERSMRDYLEILLRKAGHQVAAVGR